MENMCYMELRVIQWFFLRLLFTFYSILLCIPTNISFFLVSQILVTASSRALQEITSLRHFPVYYFSQQSIFWPYIFLAPASTISLMVWQLCQTMRNYWEETIVVWSDEWCSLLGHLVIGSMRDFIFVHHHFHKDQQQTSSRGVWCPLSIHLFLWIPRDSTVGRHLHRKYTGR